MGEAQARENAPVRLSDREHRPSMDSSGKGTRPRGRAGTVRIGMMGLGLLGLLAYRVRAKNA
jgi:hypothetical protein